MTDFPQQMKVNIPSNVFMDGECAVVVRFRIGDDVTSLKERYGRRLFNLDIAGDALGDVAFLQSLAGFRIRIRMGENLLPKSNAVVEALRKAKPVFVVRPDTSLLRNVNFLTSIGFRVHIEAAVPVSDEEVFQKTLDFFLHNPLLSIPVEPFYSLLQRVNRRRGHTLWAIESEDRATNAFVNDKGDVTLSERWADQGRVYGRLDEPWEDLTASVLYRQLVGYRETLFRKKCPCVFCDSLDICAGFLRAIDPEWPCDIWREFGSILRKEVHRARELQKNQFEKTNLDAQ